MLEPQDVCWMYSLPLEGYPCPDWMCLAAMTPDQTVFLSTGLVADESLIESTLYLPCLVTDGHIYLPTSVPIDACPQLTDVLRAIEAAVREKFWLWSAPCSELLQ